MIGPTCRRSFRWEALESIPAAAEATCVADLVALHDLPARYSPGRHHRLRMSNPRPRSALGLRGFLPEESCRRKATSELKFLGRLMRASIVRRSLRQQTTSR